MESTINDRIKDVINSLKMTPNAFASEIGVAGSVIYNILKGRNRPSFDILEKIVSTFDVSSDFLLLGKGDIIISKNNYPTQSATKEMAKQLEAKKPGKNM